MSDEPDYSVLAAWEFRGERLEIWNQRGTHVGRTLPPRPRRMGIAVDAMKADELHIPYQGHSTTSERAAQEIAGRAGSWRYMVLVCIQIHGPCSDDFIQRELAMNASTQRPRRIELVKLGLVRDSGLQGKTRSGRACTLWCAANPSEDQGRLF